MHSHVTEGLHAQSRSIAFVLDAIGAPGAHFILVYLWSMVWLLFPPINAFLFLAGELDGRKRMFQNIPSRTGVLLLNTARSSPGPILSVRR